MVPYRQGIRPRCRGAGTPETAALSDLPVRQVTRVIESLGSPTFVSRAATLSNRHPGRQAVVIPQHGTAKRGTLASILRQAGIKPGEFRDLLG